MVCCFAFPFVDFEFDSSERRLCLLHLNSIHDTDVTMAINFMRHVITSIFKQMRSLCFP